MVSVRGQGHSVLHRLLEAAARQGRADEFGGRDGYAAPQLSHGFVGARPGQPFPKHLLDAITSVEIVDDFDGFPDKWITKSPDIFERKDLPLFRVMAAVRRGGPDAEGRTSLIQVRSSHALMKARTRRC